MNKLIKVAGLSMGLGLVMMANQTKADSLTNLWSIAPGDRAYITTDNTQRGLAFNPSNGHVLVMSRAGTLNMVVLDGKTGAEINVLNVEGISGGMFYLNMISVADDGVVYAGNLSISTTSPYFKLYRWENDSPETVPTVAFEGDPAGVDEATGVSKSIQRWGDSFDVRGAGTKTMVAIGSRNSAHVAIFTTVNGTEFTPTLISGAGNSSGSLSVAFGIGNTIWSKLNSQPLRCVSFDLVKGQATQLYSFATSVFPGAIVPIAVDTANKQLGAIAIETPDSFQLFDMQDLNNPPMLIEKVNLPSDNANANVTGSVDFGTNVVYVLDSNNGVQAYTIKRTTTVEPPSIVSNPANITVLEGGPATFSVSAKGTVPFKFQWAFNGVNISGATNSSYTIAATTLDKAGTYTVTVGNAAGSVTSAEATLTLKPLVKSDALTLLWKLAPGDRPYVASDDKQRGIAYNPVTGNLLLISRTEGDKIYVLNGDTGAELRTLNTDPTTIFGGTYALNMIGVAEDGAVYACNLTTDGAGFTVYRWANDSADAAPTMAYGPDNLGMGRCGDTFDVRGSGPSTQILVSARNTKKAAVLTTTDGSMFTGNIITVDAAADSSFALGAAFGEGNTFWGKTSSSALLRCSFDLSAGTGAILNSYAATNFPALASPLSMDPVNKWLAIIAVDQPDNLHLYDISDLSQPPKLIAQALFPTDNPNINGTGSADFSGNRLYALDSNNGIMAFKVQKPTVQPAVAPVLSSPKWTAGAFQFAFSTESGRSYIVESTTDWKTWTTVSSQSGTGSSVSVTITPAGNSQYYRVKVSQ